MTGSIYLISDLHLDAARPEVTQAFASFLKAHKGAKALYILGDLFEFWVGDDDDSALASEVKRLLKEFATAGPQLFLMHGNRDFLLGESFASFCGATLLPDLTVLPWQERRILLSHGDVFCTEDHEYQAFRTLARSSEWQQQMLGQSLAARRDLAQQLRSASKHAGSRKAEDIMDVTASEVDAALIKHQCDAIIHGHTHRPSEHQHQHGERWVLGDWDRFAWWIELRDSSIDLNKKLINNNL
ncbi:MAG: UDP-2,3-diacylglucosamine diphosphatase [Pseudomonadota bacterium]